MTYSFNDHMKWSTEGGKYQVTYGRAAYKPSGLRPFRAEVTRAAAEIGVDAKNFNLPVYVYMSGGQDSEVMARGFLEAGVAFTPVMLRFENERNMHDIGRAIEFCKRMGLQPRIVDMNLSTFLREEFVDMAKKYACPDVSIMTHTWLIENLPSHYPVIGGGDLEFIRKRHNQSWWDDQLVRVEKTQSLAPIVALQKRGRPGATRFFSYTPELMYAYMTNPMLTFVIEHEKSFNSFWEREWKSMVYHEQYPDLAPRQKYNGFEKAPEAYPLSWFYGRQLNPVTDDAAALAVSQALYAVTRKVLSTEFSYPQLLSMVQPL